MFSIEGLCIFCQKKERKEGEDGWREERMEGGKTMTLHLVK